MSRRSMVIGAALFAVYFVWGTTYLALRFGLEGFPPFILNGIRFTIAGLALFAFAKWRGWPFPTKRQWINATMVGTVLLVGGVGLVTIAEDLGVGSGIAATAVAMIPVWTALIVGVLGEWPRRMEWAGLAFGLLGVVVLAQEGDFRSTAVGTALIVIAPILWSLGSVWSSKMDLPESPVMSTSVQVLAGGLVMLVLGPLRGERIDSAPSLESWLALLYLIVFGSIIAYTAYVFLLKAVRPVLATSYAYVNPVVAVIAGVAIGGEILTGPVFIAMPLILFGVALVTLGQRRRPAAEPERIPTRPIPVEEAA